MEINIESWRKKVAVGALPDEEKKAFSVELDRLSVWNGYADGRAWAITAGTTLCVVAVFIAVIGCLFSLFSDFNAPSLLLSLSYIFLPLSGAVCILGIIFYLHGHDSLDEYRKRTIDFLIKYAEALETRREP